MIEDLLSSEDKRLILVPEVVATFIWPQVPWTINEPSTYIYNCSSISKAGIIDIRALRYLDRNVVGLLKKGKTVDETVSILKRKDYYDKDHVIALKERIQFYNREKCGIDCSHISSFIEDNYTKERLFLDGRHWSDRLCQEIIKNCVDKMGIQNDDKEYRFKLIKHVADNEDRVWENEWPIYPSVIGALHLDWADDRTKYRMVKLNETISATFEEFMWNYVYHALEIQKIW